MQFALLLLLATGISCAIDLAIRGGGSTASQQPGIETAIQKSISPVDCLLTTSKEGHVSPASVVPFPKTTICTQQCVVLTFSTSIKPAGSSVYRGSIPPISTSCLTTSTTATDYSESPTPLRSLVSGPISVATRVPSFASSSTGLTAMSSSSTLISEPCSTDVTITKTIVETWWSRAPATTTLARTRSVTITTVIVETYSTSTGERTLLATRTATTTFVSLDTTCLGEKNCCAACPTPPVPEPSDQGSFTPESSVTSDFESQSIAVDSTMPTTEGDITSTSAAGAAAVTAGLVGALVGFLAVLA
ncbi:hypothetical protein BGZ61DRAFT_479964 [Ilyonectria robusta]|uniref:uncharacterized protein n=1 Tax=Ilyonectria robusta TaxID=1079257 RepID=UPI001E8DEB6B|nr:uncharacterized protein BGZ61DRAFT_479964 [Ilyonectria robusta]KAH8685204.1 hypothetical protein BGZ61DRAFT_479964 [Ilyonectria robusta]